MCLSKIGKGIGDTVSKNKVLSSMLSAVGVNLSTSGKPNDMLSNPDSELNDRFKREGLDADLNNAMPDALSTPAKMNTLTDAQTIQNQLLAKRKAMKTGRAGTILTGPRGIQSTTVLGK